MPSLSDNLDSVRENKGLNSVGSFWSDKLANRDQALGLVESCYKVKIFNQLDTALKQFLNRQDFLVTDKFLPFVAEDVIYTGDTYADDGPTVDKPYEGQSVGKLDEGNTQLWLVPLNEIQITTGLTPNIFRKVTPLKIIGDKREFILNSDFFVKNGYIQFLEDPVEVFTKGKILIAVGRIDNPSIYRFPLKHNSLRDNEHLVKFARMSQSPKHFGLAVASVAGLKVLSHKQRLKEITYTNHGSRLHYTFESEVITVDYPHTTLDVNEIYDEGHIIGGGVKLYTPNKRTKRWWREIDFKGGLALDSITGHVGLLMPDDVVMAYIADTEEDTINGDKAHVRIDLIGDPDKQDAYWEEVADKEKKLGKYLNNIVKIGHTGTSDPNFDDANFEGIFKRLETIYTNINKFNRDRGLPVEYRNVKRLKDTALIDPYNSQATPGVSYVNALDVFFESILSQKAFVMLLDSAQIKDLHNVCRFINEEKPSGCVPIILITGHNLADTMKVGDMATDSYETFEVVDYLPGGSPADEPVDLTSIIVDSYSLNLNT